MPRKKNKRKAIQALRRKLEVDEVRVPKAQPLRERERCRGNSDLALATAMAFSASRLIAGMDLSNRQEAEVIHLNEHI